MYDLRAASSVGVPARGRHPSAQSSGPLHATRSSRLPPLALSLLAAAGPRLQKAKPCTAALLSNPPGPVPAPISSVKNVVRASGLSLSQLQEPDSSSPGDQPTWQRSSTSSRGHCKEQLLPSTHQPSIPQQPPSSTCVPALALGSAAAVLLGSLTFRSTAELAGVGWTLCTQQAVTKVLTGLDPRLLAACILVVQLAMLGVVTASLALWCRRHRITVAAFLKLGVMHPRQAVWQGVVGGVGALCASFTVATLLMLLAKGVKLVWPVAMSLPHICTVSSSDDMIRGNVSRIIQSGDLLAASMFCGTAVILGPICEELFFRGMVLQCLVDAYPRLTPVVLLVTSLWFAASHSYEIVGTAVVTTCGICHGWSYLAAGRNILVPIVAHGFFNLMQLIGMLVFP